MTESLNYVPRHGPSAVTVLVLKYLIFVRRAEEVFAQILWGEPAYKVLRAALFYRDGGLCYTSASQLSSILTKHTSEHLKVELGVRYYRHLAVALGRAILGVTIDEDVDETTTTGMDAAAGRTTLTSRRIYAIENDKLGFLNEHNVAVHRATDRLWHKKILKMDMDMDMDVDDGEGGPFPSPVGGKQLQKVLRAALQESITKEFIPAVVAGVIAELKRQKLVSSIEAAPSRSPP